MRTAFDTPAERLFLWDRSGHRCEWYTAPGQRCEAEFPEPRHCQLDHLMPRRPERGLPGQTDAETNGAALCASCNGSGGKGNSIPPQWLLHAIAQDRAAHAASTRKAN